MSGHTRVRPGVHYDVSNTRFVRQSGVNHFCRHFSPLFMAVVGGSHTHFTTCQMWRHTCVPVGFEEKTLKMSQHHATSSRKKYLSKGKHLWKYSNLFSFCPCVKSGGGDRTCVALLSTKIGGPHLFNCR